MLRAALLAMYLTGNPASVYVIPVHEWLSGLSDPASNQLCCNIIDCQQEKVKEVSGGYEVVTGEVIPYSRVLWKSQDGMWWRCRNLWNNSTRCLIGPPPST